MCWTKDFRWNDEKKIFEQRDVDTHHPFDCVYSQQGEGEANKLWHLWSPERGGTGDLAASFNVGGQAAFIAYFDKENTLKFYEEVKRKPFLEQEIGNVLRAVGWL